MTNLSLARHVLIWSAYKGLPKIKPRNRVKLTDEMWQKMEPILRVDSSLGLSLAENYGVSKQSVYRRMREAGIPRTGGNWKYRRSEQ